MLDFGKILVLFPLEDAFDALLLVQMGLHFPPLLSQEGVYGIKEHLPVLLHPERLDALLLNYVLLLSNKCPQNLDLLSLIVDLTFDVSQCALIKGLLLDVVLDDHLQVPHLVDVVEGLSLL